MRTLFILNRQEEVVGFLKNGGATLEVPPYFDDLLTEDLQTGAKTFQFTTILDEKGIASNLVVGNYIAFQKDDSYELFQIMQTEEDHQETIYITVYCECAGLELINSVVRKQSLVSANYEKFITTLLQDTSWNVGTLPYYTEALDIELEDETVYSAIQNNIASYGVEISFRVEIVSGKITQKYVDACEQRGKITGKRFEFGKDIEGIQRKTDLTNVYTALIGIGNNDIDFRNVTVSGIDKPKGQDFVVNEEAFERYNNDGYHIMGIYKYDTDSPEELLRKTYEYLQECNEPKIEYTVDVALLGHLLDEDWNKVSIGDTVYIIDNYFNPPIQLAARVNKLETSEANPENDKCTFTNFIEVKSNITDEMRQIASDLEGYVNAQFPIGSDKIKDNAVTSSKIPVDAIQSDHINASTISTKHLKADSITADKIQANAITTDKLEAKSITAEKINAGAIVSEHIQSDVILANHISSEQVTTKHLQADSISADKIQANAITSDKITANAITSEKINAESITSDKIQAGAINTIHLGADSITADKIAAGTITANEIATGTITAGSGVIADGAIGSAQISSLDAAKIDAGTINTSKVTIAGANGNLKIRGNRLQVFTGIGAQQYERVSLGDVNGDGTIYGLRVRGADGETILLDENGVTSEGITDGSITNEKVADNASIDGSKLNINTVVDRLNADGTKSIVGTKIDVGDGNLSAKLSSITETQTEQGKTISSNSSKITANEKAISLKVDSQTYKTDKEAMTQTLSKHTSDISQLNDSIKLKVEATDITNAINDLEIGGVNLLTQSNDFSLLYTYKGATVEKTFDVVVSEWGNKKGTRLVSSGGTDTIKLYKPGSPAKTWGVAETFTGSMLVKNNSTTSIARVSLNSLGTSTVTDYLINPGESKQIVHTGVANVNGTMQFLFRTVSVSDNLDITVAYAKIEKGNKATDWSPAPEDVDNSITTVSNKVSSLTTDLNGITGRVSTVETTTKKLTNQTEQSRQNIRCNELGAKINYSTFTTANSGEIYLHGYDTNNNPTDTNGKIYWNGTALTVAKGMLNPNSSFGLNTDVFIFVNKNSSSTNVYGTYYNTSTKAWAYIQLIGGTASSTNWTPDKNHVAIGQFNMADAETFNHAYLYETPQALVNLTIGSMNLLSRMNSAELKITDEAITSTVSSTINTTVNNAVDKVQIGGTNLQDNTHFKYDLSDWKVGTGYTRDAEFQLDGINTAKFSRSGLTSDTISYLYSGQTNISAKAGEMFTSSGYFYCSSNNVSSIDGKVYIGIWFYDSNGSSVSSNRTEIKFTSDKWVRFTCTATAPTNTSYVAVVVETRRNGIFNVGKIKLEKGNKVTDWSISQNDISNAIVTSETALNDNIDNAVKNATNDILDNVSKNYTTSDEFVNFSQEVSSQFKQTSKDITATFKTVNDYAKEVDGKLQTYQDTVSTYIRFSNNGIDLGKTNSPFTSRLDNTKLAFCQDGEEVAYISNNKMVITTADIDDQLRIGDSASGFFIWTQGSSGNLTLKWSDK